MWNIVVLLQKPVPNRKQCWLNEIKKKTIAWEELICGFTRVLVQKQAVGIWLLEGKGDQNFTVGNGGPKARSLLEARASKPHDMSKKTEKSLQISVPTSWG